MKRTIPWVSWTRSFVFLVGLLIPLAAGTASAARLCDAELVVGGFPVLQNADSADNARARTSATAMCSTTSRRTSPVFVPTRAIALED